MVKVQTVGLSVLPFSYELLEKELISCWKRRTAKQCHSWTNISKVHAGLSEERPWRLHSVDSINNLSSLIIHSFLMSETTIWSRPLTNSASFSASGRLQLFFLLLYPLNVSGNFSEHLRAKSMVSGQFFSNFQL